MEFLKEQIVGPNDLSFYYTKFRDSPATIRSVKIPLMEPCLTQEERDRFNFFTTPLLSLYGIYIHKPSKLIIVYCKDKKSFAVRKDKYELQDIINRSLRNEILSNNEAILGVHYIDPKEFENSYDDRDKMAKEDNIELSKFTQRTRDDHENNIYEDSANDDKGDNNDNEDNEHNNNDSNNKDNDTHDKYHDIENGNDSNFNYNGNYGNFNNNNDKNDNIDDNGDNNNNNNCDNDDNNENEIDVITGNDLIEDIERYKSQLGFEIPYEVEESELENGVIPLLPIYFGYSDLKDFNKIKPVDFSNNSCKLFLKNSINNFLLYQTIYCSQEQIRLKIELNKKYKIEIILNYFTTNFDLKISRESFLVSFLKLVKKFDEFDEIESGIRFVDMYNEKESHNHSIRIQNPRPSSEKAYEIEQDTAYSESTILPAEMRNQGKEEQGGLVTEKAEVREEQKAYAYANEKDKGKWDESKVLEEQMKDKSEQKAVADESAEDINEDEKNDVDQEEVNEIKEDMNEEEGVNEEENNAEKEEKKEQESQEQVTVNKPEREEQEAEQEPLNENRTKLLEPILDLEDFYNILENIHDSQEANEGPNNKQKLNEDVNDERELSEDLSIDHGLNKELGNKQKEANEGSNKKQTDGNQGLNETQKESPTGSSKRPNPPNAYSEIKKKVSKKGPVTVSRRVLPRKVKKKPLVVTKKESQNENIIEMEYDENFGNGRSKRQRRSSSGSHKNNSLVNGLKPYACKKCGLSFHLQQTAKNHVATSHKKGTIILRKGRNPIDDSMIKANASDMEVNIPESPTSASSKNQIATASGIAGIKNPKTNSTIAIATNNNKAQGNEESTFFLQELMSSNKEESDQEYQSQKGGRIFSAID